MTFAKKGNLIRPHLHFEMHHCVWCEIYEYHNLNDIISMIRFFSFGI